MESFIINFIGLGTIGETYMYNGIDKFANEDFSATIKILEKEIGGFNNETRN